MRYLSQPVLALAGLGAGFLSVQGTASAGTPKLHSCPDRLVQPKASSWAPAHRKLVPAGPVAVRFCRYRGLNAHPPLSGVFDGFPILNLSRVVHDFDAVPASSGSSTCLNDDGVATLVTFAYRSGHTVTISVDLGGCGLLSNGSVHRRAVGRYQRLIADVKRASSPNFPKGGRIPPEWRRPRTRSQ